MKIRIPSFSTTSAAALLLLCGGLVAAAQQPTHVIGTITALGENAITIKTDQGQAVQVTVPATAVLRQVTPEAKDLSAAKTIVFTDLAVGDRTSIKLNPDAAAGTLDASILLAVKRADLLLKQQKDAEDWKRRGAGGLVKSVDAASGVLVISSGAGVATKTITVHTSKATVLKRYAANSVRPELAQIAPIDAIHIGDQLSVRGAKNAGGTEIVADEIFSGSFRNISGVIASLDAANSTFVVKDLATKKPVTVHIATDTQLHRLPDRIAQMMAARLKGATPGSASSGAPAQFASSQPMRGLSGPPQGRLGSLSEGSGAPASAGSGPAPDLQQVLSRAPAIPFSDLTKGDAVMLVATDGASDATAITLLAGVEPLLESAASRDLLSNWSVGGGSPEGASQ